jgi:hypothetical protein
MFQDYRALWRDAFLSVASLTQLLIGTLSVTWGNPSGSTITTQMIVRSLLELHVCVHKRTVVESTFFSLGAKQQT